MKDEKEYFEVPIPIHLIARAVSRNMDLQENLSKMLREHWEGEDAKEKREIMIRAAAMMLEKFSIKDIHQLLKELKK